MLATEQKEYLNAVLEWGKTHLLSPSIELYLKEIDVFCTPLVKSKELESFLSNSIEELQNQVESAISILWSEELIMATEEDSVWHEAQASFIAFDRVNYLMEAVRYLLFPAKGDTYKKALSKLDNIFIRITSWLEEGDFSPLRLTSINDFRQRYLKQIPEEKRYQFPWYEYYSDYDENILEIIAENLDSFFAKNRKKPLFGVPETQLVETAYELKRDDKLLSRLKREFAFHRELMTAVSKRSGFRLWRLGENSALDYMLPRRAEEAGPVRTSINILEDAKIYTKEEKIYWTFLPAFCCPGLDDKERLELLDKVEELIKNTDLAEISDDKAGVLRALRNWYEGKCEDSDLVEASFGPWIKFLEEKAEGLPVMEFDEDADKLLGVLNKLLSLPIKEPVYETIHPEPKQEIKEPPVSILDTIFDLIEHAIKQTILQAAPAISSGKESKETIKEETFALKEGKKSIRLTVEPNTEGEFNFLTDPNNVFSFNSERDEEEYKSLWNFMGKRTSTRKYWGGCFMAEDGESIKIEIDQVMGRFLYKTKGNNLKYAVIGISNEKEDLDKFVQLLEELDKGYDFKVDKQLKVIVLIITLETKGKLRHKKK